MQQQLRGTLVHRGFAQAPAFFLPELKLLSLEMEGRGSQTIDVELERALFEDARSNVSEQLQALAERSPQHKEVFERHRLILYEMGFTQRFEKELERGPHKASIALQRALRIYEGFVKSMSFSPFEMELLDLKDVWRQVLAHLLYQKPIAPLQLPGEVVVVGPDIYPSQLAQMPEELRGLLTTRGSRESSIARLAEVLDIPYFCDVEGLEEIQAGELLILDGMAGTLIRSPEPKLIEAYRSLAAQRRQLRLRSMPSETSCGFRVTFRTPVSAQTDLDGLESSGGEGVGMLHATRLFAQSGGLPDEESQIGLYKSVLRRVEPDPVVVETLNLGGGPKFPGIPLPDEANPKLGWRGVRISLAHRKLLKMQLSALLIASQGGLLKIAFPMVSTFEELMDIRTLLDEARQDVRSRMPQLTPKVEVGLLLETPALLTLLDHLTGHVDFLCVDLDGLLQHAMAADAQNPRLLHLLSPYQPALLRIVHRLVLDARQADLPLSAYGSFDPLYLPFLVGLGIDDCTVPAGQLVALKKRLHQFERSAAIELVHEALKLSSLQGIQALAQSFAEGLGEPGAATRPRADITATQENPKPTDAPTNPDAGDITAREQ